MSQEFKAPILLSRKQAATFLGLKENTLAVWRTTKKVNLPLIKIGGLVKYRLEDLENFLKKQTIEIV